MSRRDRRAAERQRTLDQRRGSPSASRGRARSSRSTLLRSPLVLITGAVLLLAVAVLAVALVTGRPPSTITLIDPAEPAPVDLASGHTLGRADAPVTVDLWEDFQCPNCATFARTVEPQIVTQYVRPGTAKLVFHHFAFIGASANPDGYESLLAAVAADCAGDQGRFWSYQEYLFANQGPAENGGTFNSELFDAIAQKLGLDVGKFDSCRSDPARAQAVKAARSEATAAGINATPTLHVNGKAVASWDFAALSAAIEAAAPPTSPASSTSASPAATGGAAASAGSASASQSSGSAVPEPSASAP